MLARRAQRRAGKALPCQGGRAVSVILTVAERARVPLGEVDEDVGRLCPSQPLRGVDQQGVPGLCPRAAPGAACRSKAARASAVAAPPAVWPSRAPAAGARSARARMRS